MVPAHVIDNGIPATGLLASVLVAKYADHLPLYRQEQIFARAGLAIPRSTLGAWIGRCGMQLQPLVDALHHESCSRVCCMSSRTTYASNSTMAASCAYSTHGVRAS
ncbi:transposase IS66 [Paraburkholderia hospita]|uniref:Transposase IS66 n=1 Tax=Paraburkholderia hospita TaxID=169430 RepID=A0ABN0FWL0_9BURK|nr:transposase IS66 [Paraburkholderia hospita]